jgi:hypothetical protein
MSTTQGGMSKEELLRKRGWSMASEGTTNTGGGDGNGGDNVTEASLDHHGENHINKRMRLESSTANDSKASNDDASAEDGDINENSDDDDEDLFVGSPSSSEGGPGGGAVMTDKCSAENDTIDSSKSIPIQSQFKLSKWAARLFDPNRVRGVIEPPEILPQNDEFLRAFGLREKADREGQDQAEAINENDDAIVIDVDKESEDNTNSGNKNKDGSVVPEEGSKVKLMNLKYTTKESTIQQLLELYGTIQDLKLVMDTKTDEGIKKEWSIGKAYCTFSLAVEAKACVDALQEYKLDGRPMRLQVVPNDPRRERAARNSLMGASTLSRYWDLEAENVEGTGDDANGVSASLPSFGNNLRMLGIKCRRCGEVGHMESSCSNAVQEKPCMLCGKAGHAGPRDCPTSVVCFSCGVPGHAARDCTTPRGHYAKRMVCCLCLMSGHHRWQCPLQSSYQIASSIGDAICIDCGSKGHFSCNAQKWEYNVTLRSSAGGGFSCFNCGELGHHGASCTRPKIDVCGRNPEVGQRELERAETWVDHIERSYMGRTSSSNNGGGNERGRGRDRDRDQGRNGNGGRRDSRGYNNNNNNRGSERDNDGGRRGYQDTSRRQRSRTQPPPTSRHYRTDDDVDVEVRPY